MNAILLVILTLATLYVAFLGYRRATISQREKCIATYAFPAGILAKVRERYPHLDEEQALRAVEGAREYFQLCNLAGRKMVAMPSQAADVAWHEFILFTRAYKKFCDQCIGRFLHHTPAEAMTSPTVAQRGIKTAWRISCFRENIPAHQPTKLPLLFALDSELQIPDGFEYSLNCKSSGNTGYCAAHIGCGSGCSGDGGDASGCGGGCGGD